MFRFRWLGRILLCLLVGLVLGAVILGFGPPLPKAPDHLGLDGIHKYHYNQVWERGEMPKDVDMYTYEPGDELEELTAHSYRAQLKRWKWNMDTQWRSTKFKFLRWWKETKEKREAKK